MNIAQIARLAGVSSAAVSRYFNNGYISEEKREAIRRVVEQTGYRPSVQAQTLRTKKTKMIGVIVPKISSVSIGRVVEGILGILNKNGYQMLLAVTQNDPQKELEYLKTFSGSQVDGVIFAATVFTPEHKKCLKKMTVPVVIVGQQFSGFCCVYHDDYHAMYDLTSKVLKAGRTHIGYIGALQEDKAVGEARYCGFRDAVCGGGYEALAKNYVVADFTAESGYQKAEELLAHYPSPDALICATDTIAVGAGQYLHDHRPELVGQVLLAGQGDSPMARVSRPPLLTIHYFYEKSGEVAVQMLLELLEQKNSAPHEVKLGYLMVQY